MKPSIQRLHRGSMERTAAAVICIAVNVLLAWVCNRTGVPVYLDTVGTIGMAMLGGLFPAIITAIVTNVLCTSFNSAAIYFGSINACIAIYAAWFVRDHSFRRMGSVLHFITAAGVISGVLSACMQWYIFGRPQNASVGVFLDSTGVQDDIPRFLLFVLINTLLNMFDKALSLGLALLAVRFVPEKLRRTIRTSGWRQRPLSAAEVRAMDSFSEGSRFSLKRRMTLMLLTVSSALTLVIGITGLSLYFRQAKAEKTGIAAQAVQFAAEIIDPERIDEYLRLGDAAEGYTETRDMLRRIRANAAGVQYLYVLQIREDGCYVVFDLETEDTPALGHGDKIEFEEAFFPYLPALQAGEEIEPIESNDISGWVMTVYTPIVGVSGRYPTYVGADVSMSYVAGYLVNFFIRVLLILAGFLILVLAYALWVSGIFMVYPINNIVAGVEGFIRAGTDQESLDEAVRQLRAIDVHTGDEVERLYQAICDMAANQTEQLRSIRRFSENTARMQDGLIITMADLVENRDSDTGAHIQKTAAYVRIIVEGLKRKGYYAEKITPKFMSDVVRSAPLHDVGKINIPDSVLNKPGKLTDEEYAIIKTHTTAGKHIMEKAISTVEGENYLKEARNMAAYHHERWDGRGYPEGLHGEVIPLAARIMAVADVFDALASPRVYKPAFPLEKALSIIQEGAGTQFDPKCVEVFMESLPEVREVLKKYQDQA